MIRKRCSFSENTGKQQPERRQACQHLCTAGTGPSLGATLPSGLACRVQCTQAGMDRVGYISRHLLGFHRLLFSIPDLDKKHPSRGHLHIGCEGITDIMPVISRPC